MLDKSFSACLDSLYFGIIVGVQFLYKIRRVKIFRDSTFFALNQSGTNCCKPCFVFFQSPEPGSDNFADVVIAAPCYFIFNESLVMGT